MIAASRPSPNLPHRRPVVFAEFPLARLGRIRFSISADLAGMSWPCERNCPGHVPGIRRWSVIAQAPRASR